MSALTRKAIPSPNCSSRGGAKVRLIVLHTAEGARTIESLGAFFKNPASDVSSHTGADDKPGVIGEYVRRASKAWTAANANPVAVQIELCAFASWNRAEWNRHGNMLDNCARWIAEESKAFGVPITKLSPAQAQGSGRGVCQHVDLGAWGGGHHDCGSAFPIDDVLVAARRYAGGGATDGGRDEVGYPGWFWDWVDWYLTTDRDPQKRPKRAPDKIPDWAWEGEAEVEKVGQHYGMTSGEREWIDWKMAGSPPKQRPDVPQLIPERWWPDHEYVVERAK